MLDKETVWDAAQRCRASLDAASIPHAVVGGVAVCLHGYQRSTVDVDVLIRRQDAASVKEQLTSVGFVWDDARRELRTPEDIPIHFLLSPDSASDDRSLGVTLPDPGAEETVTEIEGLRVVRLPRLIELKIACGLGNLRRTHRDFADVVELIALHDLRRSFARHLHKSLRKTFRELVLRARGEG